MKYVYVIIYGRNRINSPGTHWASYALPSKAYSTLAKAASEEGQTVEQLQERVADEHCSWRRMWTFDGKLKDYAFILELEVEK